MGLFIAHARNQCPHGGSLVAQLDTKLVADIVEVRRAEIVELIGGDDQLQAGP